MSNKKLYFLLHTNKILCVILGAQNVGIGTNSPAPSALLDITSITKGFLPPRMDSFLRNAIASSAAGLTIYNTSINAFQV